MKSILLALTLLLSNLIFSQPSISRAYLVSLGSREDISQNFTWSQDYECNFLIVASDQTVTIHANKKLEFYTLKDLGEVEDGNSHKFLMLDQDGKKCHLFVMTVDSVVLIVVEYSDTGFIYYTKPASEN